MNQTAKHRRLWGEIQQTKETKEMCNLEINRKRTTLCYKFVRRKQAHKDRGLFTSILTKPKFICFVLRSTFRRICRKQMKKKGRRLSLNGFKKKE